MDENQKRIAYENAVSVIVDNFLHQLDGNTKTLWLITDIDEALNSSVDGLHRESGDGSGWYIENPEWNRIRGKFNVDVNVKVLKLEELKTNITEKAQEFQQRAPNENEWERVNVYFQIICSKITLQGLVLIGISNLLGISATGAAAGTIVPVIGTAIGAGVGLFAGTWRAFRKMNQSDTENKQKMISAKQKDIEQVRENRQKIIDAILAHNY